MKLRFRHKMIVIILRPLIRLFCRLAYNIHYQGFEEAKNLPTPCLIIANHTTNLDPVFLSMGVPFPVFYVASDNLFRLGIFSKLIKYFFSPIPKLKISSDIRTIRDMKAALRSGASVGVFPEGNRSWCGETEEISPAIGKLIRHLGVPLVVCRIHGAYYASPRWASSDRRGKIECRLVRVLPAQKIQTMSVDEINRQVREDLHVSAAQDQKLALVAYRGKNLAENIEIALYACPHCGGLATIHSKGNRAGCGCGFSFEYDSFGLLHGAPYQTLEEWNHWQTEHLRKQLKKAEQDKQSHAFFSDENQLLYGLTRAKKATLVAQGTFSLFFDRFCFEGEQEAFTFRLDEVSRISIWSRMTLQLGLTDGRFFEVKTRDPRSAYKYQQAYYLLKGKDE